MTEETPTTFDALLSPIFEELQRLIEQHDADAGSSKLFCFDFFRIMIYTLVKGIKSLRLVATELETSDVTSKLGLPKIPFETLRDGFDRFPVAVFQGVFLYLISSISFMAIPEVELMGKIWLIDGSLFPAILTMYWAEYKSNKNAIRLHLAFELNRMLPVVFDVQSGNSNEKDFLASILEEGVTYVADRGYICFKLFKKIVDASAFFVIRVKTNLQYTVLKENPIVGVPERLFKGITDQLIHLNNDPNPEEKETYRLISFTVAGKEFLLLTNRFDLTTFQVVTLYAYRWQVELIFRFLKRTLNGLHLFNRSMRGVQIQFHLLLITALLQLKLKQDCVLQCEEDQQKTERENKSGQATAEEENQKSENKSGQATAEEENQKSESTSGQATAEEENQTSNQKNINSNDLATAEYTFLKTIGGKLKNTGKLDVIG